MTGGTFDALDRATAAVDQLAAKLAAADGIAWDEVCGLEQPDGDDCDSGTCVAAHYEDHDPDVARANYRRYARIALAHVGLAMSREAQLAAAHAADPEAQPDGTRESLATCATMLETYGPECFPPNEQGQVDFARCIMDATAAEIRAFLAADILPESTKSGGQG